MAQLLTEADLQTFNSPQTLGNLSADILQKIAATAAAFRAPYTIDRTLYDHVYITSDIHADLVRLDMILRNAQLVNTPTPDTYSDNSAEIITRILNTEWLPERTLLIIVGDIVDGQRGQPGGAVLGAVPDTKGNIELLLHAYLYNLRIKARARNSEVRFTIGNHDFTTVIMEAADPMHFYDTYVHAHAQSFFRTRANRRACLLPFYNCCPYVFLAVDNEVACVHGGLMNNSYEDLSPRLIAIQNELDAAGTFSVLDQEAIDYLADGQTPLWTRIYTAGPEHAICDTIDNRYNMVVVGHCQMAIGTPNPASRSAGQMGAYTRSILASEPYTRHRCGGLNGCVVTACVKANGPHLAFVDIGLSRAFNSNATTFETERQRRTEILYLSHSPEGPATRYYNKIVRLNTGSVGPNEVVSLNTGPNNDAEAVRARLEANYGPNYTVHDVKPARGGGWTAHVCNLLTATCTAVVLAALAQPFMRGGTRRLRPRRKYKRSNHRYTRSNHR